MKKKLSRILGLIIVLSMIASIVAFASPQSIPNGPYIQPEQFISLQSYMSNQDLYDALYKLADRSNGRMTLEIAGYSNAINGNLMEPLGYPLYVAKLGDANPDKTKVLITSQIHGNEPIGTEAIINLIQKLLSNDREAKSILDNVTIWFMPRINPDGAANINAEGILYPVRYSSQTWIPENIGLAPGTTAPWYYTTRGTGTPGYDQNRDYNPNLDFRIENFDQDIIENALNDKINFNNSNKGGFFVTPEARIVTKVFQELDPDAYFDLHHRGFNKLSEDDMRSVPIQIAAVVANPYTCPFTGKQYEVDDNVLRLGKQINALAFESIQRGSSHFGAIQKYPDVDLPGTSLGTFALNDTAIMLIEVKGQTHNLGQKQNGMLIQTVTTPLYEIFKALADGSIHNVDPAIYDKIPESAFRISRPN